MRVLGPGNRIGIWVCGCKRGCAGCANPELWYPDPRKELDMETIKTFLDAIFAKHAVDGVTISGGEPFLQTAELAELVSYLRRYTDDILLYTGYRKSTLRKRKQEARDTAYILENIAVLVDGAYLKERNQNHPLKGSENQKLYYRNQSVQLKYEKYMEERKGKSEVQNFQSADGLVAVGIHKREFNEQFGACQGKTRIQKERGTGEDEYRKRGSNDI